MNVAPKPMSTAKPSQPGRGRTPDEPVSNMNCKLKASNINFYYGSFQALHDISLEIQANQITALIGPSGCGKSTFLRTLNRINETIKNSRYNGQVLLDGQNVLELDVTNLRRRVGMVFQRPNPFPKSIFDNVAYGLRVNGLKGKQSLGDQVEQSL